MSETAKRTQAPAQVPGTRCVLDSEIRARIAEARSISTDVYADCHWHVLAQALADDCEALLGRGSRGEHMDDAKVEALAYYVCYIRDCIANGNIDPTPLEHWVNQNYGCAWVGLGTR